VCGIAGLYHPAMPAESRVRYLKRMLAGIVHRGPDEMGYYFDQTVAMGTARLSIIDLASGQQPLCDVSGRYWISFNGEIYNYRELREELAQVGCRFDTNSDTEVLLNAWIVWKHRALERLNGPFAFAVYDRHERSLMLARDRFGKRPLYYINQANDVVFASEMKCFLSYEPFRFRFDEEQIASIFRVWTPIEDQSGFKGIKQVPAGCYLHTDGRTTRIHKYTSLHFEQGAPGLSERDARALVYETLTHSVRLRLRSDVEVATYLSGGIDSAIVTKLIAENSTASVKSFSISFSDAEYDESKDQRLVAEHFGTNHTTLTIGSRDIVEELPDALWHAEVPVFRTAFVPMYLLSKLVNEHGIKVVLTGEGADEAFLGYDIFKETILRSCWNDLDPAARKKRLAGLYPYLPHRQHQTALYDFFDQHQDASDLFSHELRFHSSEGRTSLLPDGRDSLQPLLNAIELVRPQFSQFSPIQRAQWLEYKTILTGYLLSTQGDRMCLAHSVENRCPFVDKEVVKAASAVNLQFDDGFNEKYILKKTFADKLPARILTKPKQPFRAPYVGAFKEHRPDYLEAIRSRSELKKIDILDAESSASFVDAVLAKPVGSISQSENQTFMFIISMALLNDYFVNRSRPARTDTDIDSRLIRRIDGRPERLAPSQEAAMANERWPEG
jgi:asparagine synthase (glutamine-hydrolysing)